MRGTSNIDSLKIRRRFLNAMNTTIIKWFFLILLPFYEIQFIYYVIYEAVQNTLPMQILKL